MGFFSTFVHQKISKFCTQWQCVIFLTRSFKRSKSVSKYYNTFELEFFFLQHWVPPSALAVSKLHFLTAHDTEEVSFPRDSSRQVPGYADTALSCLAPGQIPNLALRHRQKFRQWLLLVWGSQECVNIQIALKKSAWCTDVSRTVEIYTHCKPEPEKERIRQRNPLDPNHQYTGCWFDKNMLSTYHQRKPNLKS